MEFLSKNKKWIGLAGCALVVISCFLTYAEASFLGLSSSASLMDIEGIDGWLFLITMGISGTLIYLNKYKPSLVTSFICVALNIFEISDVKSNSYGIMKLGIAPYLIFIGLALAIGCVFIKEDK